MKIVLEKRAPTGWFLVVLDRFYTSVALCLQLLAMRIYTIGTIKTDRLGYDKNVVHKGKKNPRGVNRGEFVFSRAQDLPTMMSTCWFDSKPVHFISTGATATESTVHRRERHGPPERVPCPKVIKDYHNWMGGADVHDQLRLQRYSIQTAIRFRKYYKTLFFGLVDMAIVNGFITHKAHMKRIGKKPMKRAVYMALLHNQLLQVKAEDFQSSLNVFSPQPNRKRRRQSGAHQLKVVDDWTGPPEKQKRRQRACKVCGLLRGDKRKSFSTTFYCEECSVDDAKCYLCPKVRNADRGNTKTCFTIWHEDYGADTTIPSSLKHTVQMRKPRKAPGKRRKTRREQDQDADSADDENE